MKTYPSNSIASNYTTTSPRTNSSSSFFDSIFSNQSEQTQKNAPIIQNIYTAPILPKNDSQNKPEIKNVSKPTPTKLTQKSPEKKTDVLAKIDTTSKSTPEKTTAATEPDDAQARLLKAILNAPSIEEVIKQGGYDYQKIANESDTTQNKTSKNSTADANTQLRTRKPEEIATTEQQQKTQAIKKPEVAPVYASADPKLNKPTIVEPKGSEQATLQDLYAQRIKSPELTLASTKSALQYTKSTMITTEKPEVVLQIAYSQLKSILKKIPNAPKSTLTQTERDTLASNLISLSEYLSSNTFGADEPTAEVMNRVSRQLEGTAHGASAKDGTQLIINNLQIAYSDLSLEQAIAKKVGAKLGPAPKRIEDWTPEYFNAYKQQVTDMLNASSNPTAIRLYRDALSRLSTAELFRQSNQSYWNSESDLEEAQSKISLAGALERNSKLMAAAKPKTSTDAEISPASTNDPGQDSTATTSKTPESLPKKPSLPQTNGSFVQKILNWFGF